MKMYMGSKKKSMEENFYIHADCEFMWNSIKFPLMLILLRLIHTKHFTP